MKHSGGCLCGSVRFEASADPLSVGYCHCKMCQRLSGSFVLPWASFRAADFVYVEGAPAVYRSSSHGRREFCAQCGAQIVFRSTDHPGTVEVNMGTLDDPAPLRPQYHIWCDSRVAWFDIDDDLHRYAASGPAG